MLQGMSESYESTVRELERRPLCLFFYFFTPLDDSFSDLQATLIATSLSKLEALNSSDKTKESKIKDKKRGGGLENQRN